MASTSENTSFDVLVIGGGPGGYIAAIRASQLGMRVGLVEREHLGGVCLNWGCIPTKALLRAAEIHHQLRNADEFGFNVKGLSFDFKKVIERSRSVAGKLRGGVAQLLKKNKVTVFDGCARLDGKEGDLRKVRVARDGKPAAALAAKHVILATGARPRSLPGLEPDGRLVWTYKEAMTPEAMPKSLLVVGAGAIGIEFASFYRDMGAEVTVVEVLDRVLPVEDEEISAFLRKCLEGRGISIHTSATVKELKRGGNDVAATIETGKAGGVSRERFERVILAVGVTGNVEEIGIEGTKIEVEKGHIHVNQWLETGESGVYAIGDLTGPPWLAHKASREGVICVEHIAGVEEARPLDPRDIPGCTYCSPQVASVGLSEKAAREEGHEVKVGRFPFIANGKALAMGEPEGLVKTVFDAKSGELLGAHMVGAEVTELIQGFAIARTLETTEAELMRTVFPHPTLSEAMHESVLDAFGRAIHF